MRKNIFAVCDMEVTYAYNFMEHLSHKRNIPFEVQAFTSVEQMRKFVQEHPIEILLISEKTMCEEVKALEIGKIIILAEGAGKTELEVYPSVYKYQSSDSVIREVMACYGEQKASTTTQPVLKKKTKIIGVYSPIGRTLKTSFSLIMGQLLAKNFNALYLNLEEYSGFEELFHTQYEHNLSDLLYYLRQNSDNFIVRLSSMIHTINQLDYIPPVLSPMDIHNTSYKEWEQFINLIIKNSNYEIVILDLGDGIDELYNLMDICEMIYMPILEDTVSKAKIKQFENLLRMWDCIPVLEKIRKITLPYCKNDIGSEQFAERLLWSELGDYTRTILREEKLL